MIMFERLEQHCFDQRVILITHHLPWPIDGLYYATGDFASITLNASLETTCERCVVLAEELGHHHTKPPDLFTAPRTVQERYERLAAQWAANALVPLSTLITAWQAGIRDPWELADYLSVTEPFLHRALELYRQRYGPEVRMDNYLITFDLLHIREVS